MSIKYYRLAKDEELPDEFCAVKDIGGEPSEYTFYVQEAENAKLQASNEVIAEDHAALCEQNAKLRELVQGLQYCAHEAYGMCARVPVGGERPFTCCPLYDFDAKEYRCEKLMLDLGVGVDW